jgi:hypothetical protein
MRLEAHRKVLCWLAAVFIFGGLPAQADMSTPIGGALCRLRILGELAADHPDAILLKSLRTAQKNGLMTPVEFKQRYSILMKRFLRYGNPGLVRGSFDIETWSDSHPPKLYVIASALMAHARANARADVGMQNHSDLVLFDLSRIYELEKQPELLKAAFVSRNFGRFESPEAFVQAVASVLVTPATVQRTIDYAHLAQFFPESASAFKSTGKVDSVVISKERAIEVLTQVGLHPYGRAGSFAIGGGSVVSSVFRPYFLEIPLVKEVILDLVSQLASTAPDRKALDFAADLTRYVTLSTKQNFPEVWSLFEKVVEHQPNLEVTTVVYEIASPRKSSPKAKMETLLREEAQ